MAIVNDGGGFDISVREELFDTVIELKETFNADFEEIYNRLEDI